MVGRYAKFATENLQVATARIEAKRDTNLINLSRFSHGRKKRGCSVAQPLEYLAPRPGLEPGTCGLTERRARRYYFSENDERIATRMGLFFPR
jgi:hypothetical protein